MAVVGLTSCKVAYFVGGFYLTNSGQGNADKTSNPANDARDHKTRPISPSPPKPSSDLQTELKDAKEPMKACSRDGARGRRKFLFYLIKTITINCELASIEMLVWT